MQHQKTQVSNPLCTKMAKTILNEMCSRLIWMTKVIPLMAS